MITCIYMRNGARKEFINSCINLYINILKLQKSSWGLIVLSKPGLIKKAKAHGVVYQGEEKTIVMEIDPKIAPNMLVDTLAHEMIHVKQIASGKLREKNGKTYWQGKVVNRKKVSYWDQPWEINAWKGQSLLANEVHKLILQKRKKKKKK